MPIADAPAAAITRLSVHDTDILCMHDANGAHCTVLTGGADPTGKQLSQIPIPERRLELTDAGTPCTWREGRLACHGTAAIDNVELVNASYLQSAQQTWFIDPARKLHAMKAFPGGVRQLAVGFLVGCALAGDGSVWCWSDPMQPRKVATPPRVAEIAVVDPFALCVRTETGEVHCTPKLAAHEPFACKLDGYACGSGGIEGPVVDLADPIVALTRPLQRLPLPEPARALVGDDGKMFVAAIENVVPSLTESFGGCVLGASGAVACFAMCEHGWGVVRVTGLPAIAELSPDPADGHALAVDGTVWTWAHACTGQVAAAQVALPPVAQLARPIGIHVGPSGGQFPTRCVLTRAGDVSCWTRDRSGHASPRYDPRTLPRSPFGDHRY